MALSQAEGVSLRRSRGKAKVSLVTCFVAILSLIGSAIAWMTVLQARSLFESTPTSPSQTQGRNLQEVSPSIDSDMVSTVECTLRNPNDLMDPTHNGVMKISVRHDLSPTAANAFVHLVKSKHFDGNFIFRALEGFLVQWGIRHKEINTGAKSGELKQKDPVLSQSLSNVRGTLAFNDTGGRNKQVFVNLKDNLHLDAQDRPFATVDEAGMKLLNNLYMGYRDGQGQVTALQKGLEAIHGQFPKWSQIEKCIVVSEFGEAAASS